jgi:hypothetical protein
MAGLIIALTGHKNAGKDGDSHVSETSFKNIKPDYVIENDGSIEALHIRTFSLFVEIIHKYVNQPPLKGTIKVPRTDRFNREGQA